ncbi:hypothetical protein DFJ73DRAFT_857822 [Zopfochytrium polystomum]|nr:hypothetical protein DFJ73DRAFT_857822 [Zopfochytrium polystomum]
MPHLTSPSADPSQWDPVTVKEEASNALLLLWAVVDLLKKGASINASNEGQDLTAADNNPNGSVEDPASLSPSLSASTVQAASSNPTSPSEEATSLENPPKLAAMTRKEREVEILSKFHATSLISILQMVQAIEAMLLEKFTVLRQHSWDSSPLAAADANGNADGDKQDALAQETGDAGELVGNVGFGGPSYDSQLLHKISLGWGVVGMIMETESKEELRILTEQNRMRWEGQSEGFLVRTIQELLDERDIEPLELVRL